MKKCAACIEKDKEIAVLKKMLRGYRQEKIHFDMDGYNTPCGLDVFSVSASSDIKEVTCHNCLRAWEKMKKGWETEKKQDERKGNKRELGLRV